MIENALIFTFVCSVIKSCEIILFLMRITGKVVTYLIE